MGDESQESVDQGRIAKRFPLAHAQSSRYNIKIALIIVERGPPSLIHNRQQKNLRSFQQVLVTKSSRKIAITPVTFPTAREA
jgi:hypothetical protein